MALNLSKEEAERRMQKAADALGQMLDRQARMLTLSTRGEEGLDFSMAFLAVTDVIGRWLVDDTPDELVAHLDQIRKGIVNSRSFHRKRESEQG